VTSTYVWSWGSNANYQCGFTGSSASTPTQLTQSTVIYFHGRILDTYAGVSAGVTDTIAWSALGQLFVWGQNAYGQLCTGSTTAHTTPYTNLVFWSGLSVKNSVISASLTAQNSIFLTYSGTGPYTYNVFVCGSSLGSYAPQLVTTSTTTLFGGVSAAPGYFLYWQGASLYYSGTIATVASTGSLTTFTAYPYYSGLNVVTASAGYGYNLVVFAAH